METITFTIAEFNKLKKYTLAEEITNTECDLYIYDNDKERQLIKIYHRQTGSYFSNKLLTINALMNNESKINMPELILPNKLVIVGNKIVGCALPYIENINLKILLNDENIPFSKKINCLKQIGLMLERIQKIKIEGKPFYLGDIHEANFIYDIAAKKLKLLI